MPAPTWDTIATTWATETITWDEANNFLLVAAVQYNLTLTLSEVIVLLLWTREASLTGDWIPQDSLP